MGPIRIGKALTICTASPADSAPRTLNVSWPTSVPNTLLVRKPMHLAACAGAECTTMSEIGRPNQRRQAHCECYV